LISPDSHMPSRVPANQKNTIPQSCRQYLPLERKTHPDRAEGEMSVLLGNVQWQGTASKKFRPPWGGLLIVGRRGEAQKQVAVLIKQIQSFATQAELGDLIQRHSKGSSVSARWRRRRIVTLLNARG